MLRVLAWATLWFTIAVILGGSVVRATESGDGCGDMWPRCEGSIFPLSGTAETYIEFTHRMMTVALAVVLIGLVVVALRETDRGAPIRRALAWAAGFFMGEVVIGAMIVLFAWTGDDVSLGRVIVVPLHLVNTFFLLGAMVVAAMLSSGGPWPRFDRRDLTDRLVLAGIGILLVVSAFGGLNALADSVFPADTFLEGVREEFGAAAPFLVRVRLIHPVVAIIGGIALLYIVRHPAFDPQRRVVVQVRMVVGIVLFQFIVGLVNVLMATPVEVQVFHLLIADILWIVFVVAAVLLFQRERADSDGVLPGTHSSEPAS